MPASDRMLPSGNRATKASAEAAMPRTKNGSFSAQTGQRAQPARPPRRRRG
jgi:hypothetical protein